MSSEPPPIRVAGPAPPPMRCPECGARRVVDAKFCPECGTAFSSVADRPTTVRVDSGIGAGFRFGIGFFLAAAIFALISWFISLLLVGAFVGALASGISGLNTIGAQRFDGTGNSTSSPFRLSGTIEVAWRANPTSSEPCWHAAIFTRPDRPGWSEILVNEPALSAAKSGTYAAVGLPAADYVLDVSTTCSWSFRLSATGP